MTFGRGFWCYDLAPLKAAPAEGSLPAIRAIYVHLGSADSLVTVKADAPKSCKSTFVNVLYTASPATLHL